MASWLVSDEMRWANFSPSSKKEPHITLTGRRRWRRSVDTLEDIKSYGKGKCASLLFLKIIVPDIPLLLLFFVVSYLVAFFGYVTHWMKPKETAETKAEKISTAEAVMNLLKKYF